ncbi:hypothetical protein D3C74_49760 [compost metagenome]
MKVTKGSFWRCITEDNKRGKLCVVKFVDDNPDFNGDGSIELLYSDGSVHYGKVRRFIPGITHKFVKGGQ